MIWKGRQGSLGRCPPYAVVAIACALGACTVADGELGRVGSIDGGASCSLASPIVSPRGIPTCAGRLAASLLSNALCVCGDAEVASSFITRGFDSRQGPYLVAGPNQGGASVGINGTYGSLAGSVDVGGSFSVAGSPDLHFAGGLSVMGDLWAAGNVSVEGAATVGRDAWLAGTYTGSGRLSVAGTLNHGGAVSAQPLSVGTDRPEPVTVSPPCPCGPDDLLDIGALVQTAQRDNDDQTLGVRPQQFAALSGASEAWTLPCGRAYLTGIGGKGNLAVHVNGMSTIFVDGDIALTGDLLFDIAPGAELDVFVKGDAAVYGTFSLAKKEHPAAGRIWIGGTKIAPLASPWVGTLYAPHATVSTLVGLEAWGSIFAAGFSGSLFSTFIFDRAILDAGVTCSAPQPSAGQCRQCGTCSAGSACLGGLCSACVTDADCCSLSICANGSCEALLVESIGPAPVPPATPPTPSLPLPTH